MLDHSLFLYGTGISDSNTHSYEDLPIAVVGGKAAGIQGGRYVRLSAGDPARQPARHAARSARRSRREVWRQRGTIGWPQRDRARRIVRSIESIYATPRKSSHLDGGACPVQWRWGPTPQRELTLLPRPGVPWPRLTIAAGAECIWLRSALRLLGSPGPVLQPVVSHRCAEPSIQVLPHVAVRSYDDGSPVPRQASVELRTRRSSRHTRRDRSDVTISSTDSADADPGLTGEHCRP